MHHLPASPYRPYVFLLKEGDEIQDDFFDYSLTLLATDDLQQQLLPAPATNEARAPYRGPYLASFGQELRKATKKN